MQRPLALAYADTGSLPIRIGDVQRRSGLYILGRSGTGKTELLKRLVLSDIDSGHGVFFLDPHDDAIDDLIGRIPPHRVADVISLNPMDETHSFAINLLACRNIHSWTEREHAYTRAKGVFDKLWRNTIVDVPWLQLIIEYTLPVFIQNQEYTLSEVPMFMTDPAFRDHLLGNVRYDMDIVRFWRHEFHQKQADAAITRVRMLLGRPPVKHIVSQRKTTLNFASLINEKRIVLFKLPASLAIDTKTFIGLILINELVHAVRQRREGARQQFCVFVDEVQHFANADDFATLINEGRKFGIATTVAHQERVGQFADDKKILGATDAAGNKIFF